MERVGCHSILISAIQQDIEAMLMHKAKHSE